MGQDPAAALSTPPLHQWKMGEKHSPHPPQSPGSDTRAHTWANTELVGTAQARCRGKSSDMGGKNSDRGPLAGREPWMGPHTRACVHTRERMDSHAHCDTLAYVCTQMWVCTCLHTVLVPCGEGPGCRGGGVDWHPTHISERVIPYFQARKLSPMQHPTNPHPPPLGMGSSALALGMCCQEGEEQRTRKWTTGEWRWGYLRWNLIGQFAWKQRDRDSEKEGGWKRSRGGLRAGAGVESRIWSHAAGQMGRRVEGCPAPGDILPLGHSVEVLNVGPSIKGQCVQVPS